MRRLVVLAAAACAVAGCSAPGTHTYRVPSSAMEPTIHCARPGPGCLAAKDDKVVVKAAKTLRRGDIIAFRAPARTKQVCGTSGVFVKRVIGLPGDRIAYDGTTLRRDGKRVAEPYVSPSLRGGDVGTWKVPAGTYFVIGDARDQSCDSRVWGPLPKANVIGKVVKIVRPH